MTSKILILGKNGQLGRALTAQLGDTAFALPRDKCDLLSKHWISMLERYRSPITAVINAAAYTQVDNAQGDGKDEAIRTNGEAVAELAAWCHKKNIPLVHFSTDYVFDGTATTPYKESDTPNPLNVYATSKLAGELAIQQEGGRYLIFRTSWLYDSQGRNFFATMRSLMREHKQLRVVNDQFGAPTYTVHLAKAVLAALEQALKMQEFPSGIYHLSNSGETTWHGFANAILEHERKVAANIFCTEIIAVPNSEYPLPAQRPSNSRLDCSLAQKTFETQLPSWQEGLRECFESIDPLT